MSASYVEFQVAHELYGRAPRELEGGQRARVAQVAARRMAIEARVLASREACGVQLPPSALAQAEDELRRRYADEEAFAADLARNGLSFAGVREVLERQLRVDGVLERIAAEAEAVSPIDIELFYRLHAERFTLPERRRARHILVTINEDFIENRREAARARIEEACAALRSRSFAELARQYSECPTAMDGGLLGEVRRGMLYPELEAVLFELGVGESSGIVESPLGFHLLRCEAVLPEERETLEQATPRIREYLQGRRALSHQRAWLGRLMAHEGE